MDTKSIPLCVDLDGTLVATDTLWESLLLLLRTQLLTVFMLPIWLMQGGRAYLKHQIAQRVQLEAHTLPYRETVLAFLQEEHQSGRQLVLATAAHQTIAQAVAEHLAFFSTVIASDAHTNMKGARKRDALKQHFGIYDYIGDAKADLPIFQAARQRIAVAPSKALLKHLSPDQILPTTPATLSTWLKALRPHQWVKNVLLFVPITLSHQFTDLIKVQETLWAFLAFSLVASAGYIVNDLLDLPADRVHSTKKNRPFAAGRIAIPWGLVLFAGLISLSLLIAYLQLPTNFIGIVGLYLLFTLAYSFYFKGKLILDVLVLAGLYTLRIFAGGIAATVDISSWLLVFSMFMFISLAFLKRYIELLNLDDRKMIKHRDYGLEDKAMIASMGPTSGYLSVLVFSFYINNESVSELYPAPFLLWAIGPFLLYWITRLWFLARRGRVIDDPVQFALTDENSWFTIACIIVCMLLAKFI